MKPLSISLPEVRLGSQSKPLGNRSAERSLFEPFVDSGATGGGSEDFKRISRRGRRAAAAGLSLLHKCSLGAKAEVVAPGEFVLSIPKGGSCVRVREAGVKRDRLPINTKRGAIKGFSHASRLRMLELLGLIDQSRVKCTFFMTLTIPSQDACTWPELERHRRVYLHRFSRRWDTDHCFVTWKKEVGEVGGLLHLHALVFWLRDVPTVKEFREWNDVAWAEVVKSVNPHHQQRGCRVEKMNTWNGVKFYASKYLCKDQLQPEEETGRIWGIAFRQAMAAVVDVRAEVVQAEVGKRVRRVLRKLQEKKRTYWMAKQSSGWIRLKPGWRLENGTREKRCMTTEQRIEEHRASGHRIKRVRPCVMRRERVPVFVETEETRGSTPLQKWVSRETEEIHSYAPALHFLTADPVFRLVEFMKRRVAADVAECADLPF